MSKNKIVMLGFDRSTFPFSPAYRRWDLSNEGGQVVLTGYDKENYEDDFTTVFGDFESGYAPVLPEGEYSLIAKILKGEDKFKISFSFFNIDTATIEAETIFDAKDYIENYSTIFNIAGGMRSEEENERLERRFSTAYLKKTFAGLIRGNDSFWTRLYRDLDMATTPTNIEISMERGNLEPQPIIIKDGLSYP